jgi:hypothetical protein
MHRRVWTVWSTGPSRAKPAQVPCQVRARILALTRHRDTVNFNLHTYHPALIDAGFADLDLPIPWWDKPPTTLPVPPR